MKFVARHAGCLHNELMGAIQQVSGESSQQVGGYLKVLSERYRLVEKKLPVFAAEKVRRGRYYLTDNFLRAGWRRWQAQSPHSTSSPWRNSWMTPPYACRK